MIWFTSDTHFGHENIIRFCDRPWKSADEMNDALIEVINERVAPDDILYHLGDFSFKMSQDAARDVRRRIRCREIHWVPGNHDWDWGKTDLAGTFVVEPAIVALGCEGAPELVLCHYPIMDWPGLGRGAIHLHGHIHATRAYNEEMRAERLLRYDVGVDANGYVPASLDEILAFFDGVKPRPYTRDDEAKTSAF